MKAISVRSSGRYVKGSGTAHDFSHLIDDGGCIVSCHKLGSRDDQSVVQDAHNVCCTLHDEIGLAALQTAALSRT